MKKILFICFLFAFIMNNLHAQIELKKNRITDLSIKENILLNDTSSSHVLEMPFLTFDIEFISNPGLYRFLTKDDQNIIIDLRAYKNNTRNIGYHCIDLQNHLLYYAFKNNQVVYSF